MNAACHFVQASQRFVSPGLEPYARLCHSWFPRPLRGGHDVDVRLLSLSHTMAGFVQNRCGGAITGKIRFWNVTIKYVLGKVINNRWGRHTDTPQARTQPSVLRYAIIWSVCRAMGPWTDYIVSYVLRSGLSKSGVLMSASTGELSWKKPYSSIRAL